MKTKILTSAHALRNTSEKIARKILPILLILSNLRGFGQLPTNNLPLAGLDLQTSTNGVLIAPANFFAANSNLMNLSVAGGGGGGGIGTNAQSFFTGNLVESNLFLAPGQIQATNTNNIIFGQLFETTNLGNSVVIRSNGTVAASASMTAPTFNGNATSATTATSFSGSLAGDISGTQGATVIATNGGATGGLFVRTNDTTRTLTLGNSASVFNGNATLNALTLMTGTASNLFTAAGGFAASVTAQSGVYTVGANDTVINLTNGGVAIMPDATTVKGRCYVVLNLGGGTAIITNKTGAQIFSYQQWLAISNSVAGLATGLRSDGTNWNIDFPCYTTTFYQGPNGNGCALTNVPHAGSWRALTNITLYSENFHRSSLGANWKLGGNTVAYITNGSSSTGDLIFGTPTPGGSGDILYLTNWPTDAQDVQVHFQLQALAASGTTTYGVQFGFHSLEGSGGNDFAWGLGYNTSAVGNLYAFNGVVPSSGLGTAGMSGTQVPWAVNDTLDCTITRAKWYSSFFVTNLTQGGCAIVNHVNNPANIALGAEETTSYPCIYISGGTIYKMPGGAYPSGWNYYYTRPQPFFLLVGNSIDSGYYSDTPFTGYQGILDRDVYGGCDFYGASSATMEGIALCSNELNLICTTNTRVIYDPAGNSYAGGTNASIWTNDYKNLLVNWTNKGPVYYMMPSARTSFNMAGMLPIIAGIATNDFIDAFSATSSNLSTLLQINYDHGDGTHLTPAGHAAVAAVIEAYLQKKSATNVLRNYAP